MATSIYVSLCINNPSFLLFIETVWNSFVNEQKFIESRYADEINKISVVIGNGCWINANFTIISVVTIGDGAVILAGAVVTKNVPPYAIVGGIPAKILKFRYNDEDIQFLLKTQWLNKDVSWLKKNSCKFVDFKFFKNIISNDVMKVKQLFKSIFYPLVIIRRRCILKRNNRWAQENPKALANYLYKNVMGHDINWDNPKDFNEKINWLKFYSDTTEWTKCADKYLVRSYVEDKGLGHILPKLYGVWSDANDIDFSKLPEKFVLKTNHGCATVLLVKEKSKLNIDEVKGQFNGWLKLSYGKLSAEPHYLGIKPLVIAEEFLEPSLGMELIDYKLFMINGKFELALVCSDRKIGVGCKLSIYDKQWNLCPEKLAGVHLEDNVASIPRPKTFDDMVRCAEILSSDFPQVRVDFYEVNNRLYFGELTFTSQGGYMNYIAKDELLRLGNKLILPKSDCN